MAIVRFLTISLRQLSLYLECNDIPFVPNITLRSLQLFQIGGLACYRLSDKYQVMPVNRPLI